MANRERPLSPFMLGRTYRLQMTSVMSLLHRVTGVALTFGSLALAWWLLAVAEGGDSYARAARWLASPLGLVLLGAFSLSLVYHLLNGLRHLAWDAGWGLDIPAVYASGKVVAVLTVLLTAMIWVVALGVSA